MRTRKEWHLRLPMCAFLNDVPERYQMGVRDCCYRQPMEGCARAKEQERGTRRGLQEHGGVVAWQRRDALDAN